MMNLISWCERRPIASRNNVWRLSCFKLGLSGDSHSKCASTSNHAAKNINFPKWIFVKWKVLKHLSAVSSCLFRHSRASNFWCINWFFAIPGPTNTIVPPSCSWIVSLFIWAFSCPPPPEPLTRRREECSTLIFYQQFLSFIELRGNWNFISLDWLWRRSID